jgi:SAM-dependent methyltransferase
VKKNSSKRETCRLCESKKLDLVVPLAPTPLAEKYFPDSETAGKQQFYDMDLHMCLECGHVQLLEVVNPEVLWDDYTYHSGQTRGIIDHFEDCAEMISKRHTPDKNSFVVDVGSNDGSFLRCFQKRGLRVLGVDPAREIARKATDSGVETLAEFLSPDLAEKITTQHGSASIVTAFNVFAHTDDLEGMVRSIRSLLSPEGIFVFEVSYLQNIIDDMLLGTFFHEHLSHHSVKPLIQFLERNGLELIDLQRVSIQGGSLIGIAQLAGGPHTVSASVGEIVSIEEDRLLDRPETLRSFADKLSGLRQQVSKLTEGWADQGISAAGFGAARSGNTLIAQMGLKDLIDYIVDDHPQKVNKRIGGYDIPVLPTKELTERRPDYTFILAWIHAKKIIAGNREYLKGGGKFIVCCPELLVVDAEFDLK